MRYFEDIQKQKIEEFFYYDSPEDLLFHVENINPIKDGMLSEIASSNKEKSSSWSDTVSLDDAIKKARAGDAEIASQISPKQIDLVDSGKLACIAYDTEGDFVDIGKFLTGEPECMGSMRRKGKPIVRIIMNSCFHWEIKSDTVIRRGKAILDIMSGLEQSGYAVQIDLCIRTLGIDSNYTQTIMLKLKDPKEYFNLQSLSFWLVSPSVLRRFYFKIAEGVKAEYQKMIGSGYGSPSNLPQEYLDQHDDAIYFPVIENNYENYEKSVKQVVKKYAL
jgi:hypothetical protein